MKLKATRYDCHFDNPGGYHFDVTVVHDDEWGWESQVSFRSHGLEDPHAALRHLRFAAEAFIRQLSDAVLEGVTIGNVLGMNGQKDDAPSAGTPRASDGTTDDD